MLKFPQKKKEKKEKKKEEDQNFIFIFFEGPNVLQYSSSCTEVGFFFSFLFFPPFFSFLM
jgi:hypothetical protein